MKPFQIALSFLLITILCPAQNTQSIVIRFLNGKNGKPIGDKQVTIGLGKSGAVARDADSKGEIVLDIPNVEPRELRVRPDDYFDCRFKHDQMGPGGLELKYSLDEIISKGVVGNNLCGKAHVLPTPGVLTLYLRPRTFMELWKL
ncbi:MAG: hypothetical protein ABSG23_04105 [Terriglobales bacterium]|jgi:hypothetical protein